MNRVPTAADVAVDESKTLHEALGDARRLGMLGGRAIDEVIAHAMSFVAALADVSGVVVDLGAGGGVPGLVIASARPDLGLVMVDRRTKRTDFLSRAVRRLGWSDRVEVVAGDVDRLIRDRGTTFDAAVARGFGPPEVTLPLAAALVVDHGIVVISEPPEGDRWPAALLERCGVQRVDAPAGVASFCRR